MMRLRKEDDILDINVRKTVIDEINGNENKRRKDVHYKRAEIYKDQTFRYVIDLLQKQFELDTVFEMQFSMANISIMKKIVNKLARVYSNGVERTTSSATDEDNDKLHGLEDLLDIDSVMKNTNRILKYQKNVAVQVKPIKYFDTSGNEKYRIKVVPLAPYLYDVIEDYYDRTKPMVYILSNYKRETTEKYSLVDAGLEGRAFNTSYARSPGDNKDQTIADTPKDMDRDKTKENEEYIFWTNSYHFTCNGYGEIISEGFENPIGVLPFTNYAIDQDGSFWAQGGEDLSMGAVLINSMITNINYVGIVQGYGQFWMKGKNLPRKIKMSPKTAITMEYNEGEPVPELGFVSSNPPLQSLMQMVETYIALLLTTNNLSTSGVSTELKSGTSFASGIALMIDKAESMEDVRDQQQLFVDNEKRMWSQINKWLELYSSEGVLDTDFEEYILPEDLNVNISFPSTPTILTEQEKLENIQKRKDLGLNTMIELLMKDNPELTIEEAEEKLLKIQEEKTSNMLRTVNNMVGTSNKDEDDNEDNDEDNDDKEINESTENENNQ